MKFTSEEAMIKPRSSDHSVMTTSAMEVDVLLQKNALTPKVFYSSKDPIFSSQLKINPKLKPSNCIKN